MANYKNLDKFMEKRGIKPKTKTKPSKDFKTLNTVEKDALLEKILKDQGYIN